MKKKISGERPETMWKHGNFVCRRTSKPIHREKSQNQCKASVNENINKRKKTNKKQMQVSKPRQCGSTARYCLQCGNIPHEYILLWTRSHEGTRVGVSLVLPELTGNQRRHTRITCVVAGRYRPRMTNNLTT